MSLGSIHRSAGRKLPKFNPFAIVQVGVSLEARSAGLYAFFLIPWSIFSTPLKENGFWFYLFLRVGVRLHWEGRPAEGPGAEERLLALLGIGPSHSHTTAALLLFSTELTWPTSKTSPLPGMHVNLWEKHLLSLLVLSWASSPIAYASNIS